MKISTTKLHQEVENEIQGEKVNCIIRHTPLTNRHKIVKL